MVETIRQCQSCAHNVSPSGFRAPYAAIIIPEFGNHKTEARHRWPEAQERHGAEEGKEGGEAGIHFL